MANNSGAAGYYMGNRVAMHQDVSKKGTPCVVLKFELTQIARDGAWAPLDQPSTAYVYWYLSEAAWPNTEQKLRKIEFNGNWDNMDAVHLRDNVTLELRYEDFEGKQIAKWDLPDFAGGRDAQAWPEDFKRQIAARWKTANLAAGKPSAAPPPPKAPAPATARRTVAPPPVADPGAAMPEDDGPPPGDSIPF